METQRNWKVILSVVVIILFVGAALWYVMSSKTSTSVSQTATSTTTSGDSNVISAIFNCPDGRSINASFDNNANTVHLTLSDGRDMTLPHAISADGARYANADESFVFWNVGNGATIQEMGTTTYSGCITNS